MGSLFVFVIRYSNIVRNNRFGLHSLTLLTECCCCVCWFDVLCHCFFTRWPTVTWYSVINSKHWVNVYQYGISGIRTDKHYNIGPIHWIILNSESDNTSFTYAFAYVFFYQSVPLIFVFIEWYMYEGLKLSLEPEGKDMMLAPHNNVFMYVVPSFSTNVRNFQVYWLTSFWAI